MLSTTSADQLVQRISAAYPDLSKQLKAIALHIEKTATTWALKAFRTWRANAASNPAPWCASPSISVSPALPNCKPFSGTTCRARSRPGVITSPVFAT